MSDLKQLEATIDAAYERRAELTPKNLPREVDAALQECIALLDAGEARVAEPHAGGWRVNQWLKKAVLLSFRTRDNTPLDAGFTRFYDKVPLKYASATEEQLRAGGARIVPHAVVRRGAYIAPNVVLMPCYVNIGAWVGCGHHGRHLGDGRLVRPDRPQCAPVRRRGHRRGARAAAGQPDDHRR